MFLQVPCVPVHDVYSGNVEFLLVCVSAGHLCGGAGWPHQHLQCPPQPKGHRTGKQKDLPEADAGTAACSNQALCNQSPGL